MKKILIIYCNNFSHKQAANYIGDRLSNYDVKLSLAYNSNSNINNDNKIQQFLLSNQNIEKKVEHYICQTIKKSPLISQVRQHYTQLLSSFDADLILVDIIAIKDIEALSILGRNIRLFTNIATINPAFEIVINYLNKTNHTLLIEGSAAINGQHQFSAKVDYLGYLNEFKPTAVSTSSNQAAKDYKIKILVSLGTIFGRYFYLYDLLIKTFGNTDIYFEIVLGNQHIQYHAPSRVKNFSIINKANLSIACYHIMIF